MTSGSSKTRRNASQKSESIFSVKKKFLNPALASLFTTNADPVRSTNKLLPETVVSASPALRTSGIHNDETKVEAPAAAKNEESAGALAAAESVRRKRKRRTDDENLEGRYMQKLAREDAREQAQRDAERKSKRQKQEATSGVAVKPTTLDYDAENVSDERDIENDMDDNDTDDDDDDDDGTLPQHESLTTATKPDTDLDKAARTVFLSNVSTTAIISKSNKKALLAHLSSFFSDITKGDGDPPHRVESIRFRSTAYASVIPKKAAFAKRELMDTTMKSTNAYAVYSTKAAARESARRLNGTVVLDRHLRVDEVSHPAKIDHRRCVFVGNLGFVDDESQIKAAEDADSGRKSTRKRPAGDVEEGLWRQFMLAGKVESVRVVRDAKTRVGKGFAYVQFTDENGVEAALQFNEKKYPPMLPRKLRVVRAKKVARNSSKGENPSDRSSIGKFKKPSSRREKSATGANQQSLDGRAGKLLGRAGAANMRQAGRDTKEPAAAKPAAGVVTFKAPEAFVFEGHRASSTQGNRGLRLGGARKKKPGRPAGRSARRGADWKSKVASGGGPK